MEFEILGETEDWLLMKPEYKGVEYLGTYYCHSNLDFFLHKNT